MTKKGIKKETTPKELSVITDAGLVGPGREIGSDIQSIIAHPSTIGILEFLTGLATTVVDKPSNFILSGGRLAQAAFKGEIYQQLYAEIKEYRDLGKITDKQLESSQGKSLFRELLKAIDEEALDEIKFNALRMIFIKSIGTDVDEQSQIRAYQYFLVCKKLSSLDILILKTAFEVYNSTDSTQRSTGINDWEKVISEKLGIPRELITLSRLRNSGISQTPNTIIFDAERADNRHGLTELGIRIAEFITQGS